MLVLIICFLLVGQNGSLTPKLTLLAEPNQAAQKNTAIPFDATSAFKSLTSPLHFLKGTYLNHFQDLI